MKNQTPPNLPRVPNDFIYYGEGPLKVIADGKHVKHMKDVAATLEGCGQWDTMHWGNSEFNYYALRKNSEIAKLNGLTNTETMKTQPHTKQMKLTLKLIPVDKIQVPANMVAFSIGEQEAVETPIFKAKNGIEIRKEGYPEWRVNSNRFYIRGISCEKDNIIIVASITDYKRIVEAINEFVSHANTPKILYTATFFYKNEKNGSQKRRMIEVITENDTHLAGNDKDDGGKYKNFLKSNVIGAIDKVKS